MKVRPKGTTTTRVGTEYSLPVLWKHAMATYGRWQGYAWSTVVVAGGAAYALATLAGPSGPETSAQGGDEEKGGRMKG
jgi:hypothetical protein